MPVQSGLTGKEIHIYFGDLFFPINLTLGGAGVSLLLCPFSEFHKYGCIMRHSGAGMMC